MYGQKNNRIRIKKNYKANTTNLTVVIIWLERTRYSHSYLWRFLPQVRRTINTLIKLPRTLRISEKLKRY